MEERNKGKFKGKRLIFTPENIEEMEKFTNEQKINDENTIPDKTVTDFLEPSEDSLYLEDNKRIEDINNTHTGEDKKVDDNLKQEEEMVEQLGEWATIDSVAKYFKRHRNTISYKLDAGDILYKRIGNKILIYIKSLIFLLE